jgi:5-bromo-4-chloroindolyl phosphate hydrolysis protein
MTVERFFTWVMLVFGVLLIINALTDGIWLSIIAPVVGVPATIVQIVIGSLMVYYARKWLA